MARGGGQGVEMIGADQPVLDLQSTRRPGSVSYTLTLPFLPPSKNVSNNWKPEWRTAAKMRWQRHLKGRLEELGVPLGNARLGLAARLIFGQDTNRPIPRRDPQNYAQELWHWVPDALVRLGYLVDDNAGRINWPGNLGITMAVDVRPGLAAKKKDRTVLAIAVPIELPEEPA